MEKLRTLDLFSGIGGFTLGLDSTGYFETVAFCEIEAFPCKVLNKHWPEVPIYNDVKELSYEKLQADGIISRRRGIDVICGGYPCQPFSVAGRQGGEDDPRHLWPEYFRLVRELRPHYAIGENVGGHLRLGLDTVLEDLDSENYTVRCFSVEAASLGAPHRRERIFWIADRNPNGSNVDQKQKVQERASAQSHGARDDRTGKTLGNTESDNASKQKRNEDKLKGQKNIKERTRLFNEFRRTSEDVGNTERNGSSAPEIGGGNTKTPGRTAQGKGKTLEPTGTGGHGDNEDVSDPGGKRKKRLPKMDKNTQRKTETRTKLGWDSQDVPDTDSKRRGGRDLSGRGAEQRELLKTEQEGRALGREAKRCSELPGQEGEDSAPDVADASSNGRDAERTDQETRGTLGSSEEGRMLEPEGSGSRSELPGTEYATDTHSEGLEGTEKARNSEEERTIAEQFTARQGAQRSEEERRKTTFESYLGGGNDGISAWLDGSWERGIPRVAPSNKMRVPRLKALGNAVLPQLVYMVGMAIVLSTKSGENEE